MDTVMSYGGLAIAVLVFVGTFAVILKMVASFYKKVSPNVVAVVSGRNYKYTVGEGEHQLVKERGFKFVTGGGFFLIPVIEKMEEMDLSVMVIPVAVTNVPDKNGALVTVKAVANVKILSDAASLPLAIERFLGKEIEEIKSMISQTLEGNLRAIVGTMSIEELIKERQTFQQNVLSEAGTDLAKLGLGVDVLKVQDVKDDRGYIESLGKKQTAQVVRDATIGEAEAHRDAAIKSAEAKQLGEVATAKSEQNISDANRERDMRIADNNAMVGAQNAQIPIAAEIAAANRTKELNTARVDAEKATVTAGIALQEEEKKRHAAELDATIIVKAEKDRDALVIVADGRQQAATRDGEAGRILKEKEGQGEQARLTSLAEGRKAAASADQAEMEAKANGEKAKLLATAAGTKAQQEAEADGDKAKRLAIAEGTGALLLAEAKGISEKAKAFKELDDAGRFLMILNALPPVIEALGIAVEKTMKPMAEAIGHGIGNVDEIRIIDMGGNGADGTDGKSVVGKFANLPVETMFNLVEKLKASPGMVDMVKSMGKRFGIDLDPVFAASGTSNAATTGTSVTTTGNVAGAEGVNK